MDRYDPRLASYLATTSSTVPTTSPPPSAPERRPRVPLPSPSFHQFISSIPPLSSLIGTHMTPPPPPPADQPSCPHPASFSKNDYDYPLWGPIPADSLHKFLCPVSNNIDSNCQTIVVNAETLKNDRYGFIFKAHERKQRQKAQFFATTQSQNTNIHIESIEDVRPLTNIMDVEPSFVNDNVNRNIDRDIIIIEDEDELPSHVWSSNADQEMAAASSAVGFSGKKGGVIDDCNKLICVLLTEDEPPSLEELSEWSSSYERLVNQNDDHNFDGSEYSGTSTFQGLGEGTLGSTSNLKGKKVSDNSVSKRSADLVDLGSHRYNTCSKPKRCLEFSPLEVDQFGLPSNSKRKEVVGSLSHESGSRRRNYNTQVGIRTGCGNLEYSTREMSPMTRNASQLMLSRLKSSATLTGFFANVAPFFTKFRAMNWGICFGVETELSSDAISKERLYSLYGITRTERF